MRFPTKGTGPLYTHSMTFDCPPNLCSYNSPRDAGAGRRIQISQVPKRHFLTLTIRTIDISSTQMRCASKPPLSYLKLSVASKHAQAHTQKQSEMTPGGAVRRCGRRQGMSPRPTGSSKSFTARHPILRRPVPPWNSRMAMLGRRVDEWCSMARAFGPRYAGNRFSGGYWLLKTQNM